jgi:hypothetical protein
MRKLLLILTLFVSLGAFAQRQISELTAATSLIDSHYVLTQYGYQNYKVQGRFIGKTRMDSLATALNGKAKSITLTTTGSSGAATWNSTTGELNIPTYTGGGGSVSAWGDLTGTLSDQTDLQDSLNTRIKYTDSSTMLADYRTALLARVLYTDTSTILSAYRTALNARGNLTGGNTWSGDQTFTGQLMAHNLEGAATVADSMLFLDRATGKIQMVPVPPPGAPDGTVIDGSTNAVSGNAVYDELSLKVTGPASATNLGIPVYDGTTGKLIKGVSNATITTSGLLTIDSINISGATGTGTRVLTLNSSNAVTPIETISDNSYFAIYCGHSAFSPSDATTYYFGPSLITSIATSSTLARQGAVPMDCTLKGFAITTYNNVAGATQETGTVSIRINNTTDVQLSNAVTFSASSQTTSSFYSMALSQALSAGDKFEIKWLTPTWATNPTNCVTTVTLYFQPN